MSATSRIVATSAGDFTLRPERPDDAAFLRRLFVANHAGVLRDAGIAEPVIADLMDVQFRSQADTYRRPFPHAEFLIVERDGAAIGRWISDDDGDAELLVDIALLPDSQNRGLGAAFVAAMMRRALDRGKAPRASVLVSNLPCLKMCRRIGFRVVDQDDVYVHLRGVRDVGRDAGDPDIDLRRRETRSRGSTL
ncbi:GNAT family N-acetyltransferase [Rhodopseudomonas sp. P2A-2r]|uniref:GNAT family N-acetyltransferase n=1 Tax=Rhodopseudomonas sp. P2A-2r TaxID=2991972 RepID=UPI002234BFA7|nr:GNAT family N-acetyltransferase [Rhodopseudomonas sp. P2A-2r]UZE48935.1 GNAT family N-acetyltransferase [Rhodopseudomonas sp. P2A-2r]